MAEALGWPMRSAAISSRRGRRIVIHPGAANPIRVWPRPRFEELAHRLRNDGWEVHLIDENLPALEDLLTILDSADRFIGNDSGPGHLAALLGVPTFTIFGPQLPELFAPCHPLAGWIEGKSCPHRPCFDQCQFQRAHCILDLTVAEVWHDVAAWMTRLPNEGLIPRNGA